MKNEEDDQKNLDEYVLSLDLSLLNTGYSVYNIKTFKFVEVGSIPTCSDEPLYKRLNKIHKKLALLMLTYKFNKYIIERSFVSKYKLSTMQVMRVSGIAIFTLGDIECIEVASTSVKLYVTGNGKSKKEEVKKCVLEKYSYLKFNNMDESDSVAIMMKGLEL